MPVCDGEHKVPGDPCVSEVTRELSSIKHVSTRNARGRPLHREFVCRTVCAGTFWHVPPRPDNWGEDQSRTGQDHHAGSHCLSFISDL